MNVLIFRDPRESTRKCSLTPLRGHPLLRFVNDRPSQVPPFVLEAGPRVLLHPDGEELSAADAGQDLLLIDCSWRRLAPMLARVQGELTPRRLPPLVTAYPRKNKQGEDPSAGLASVEALYAALVLMGESRPELLEGYRWADAFLELNPALAPHR